MFRRLCMVLRIPPKANRGREQPSTSWRLEDSVSYRDIAGIDWVLYQSMAACLVQAQPSGAAIPASARNDYCIGLSGCLLLLQLFCTLSPIEP